MLKEEEIANMNSAIKTIVMDDANIIKYLDLYNYPIKCYETMNEYILDNYNYELFGKNLHWSQLETVGSRNIQYFIPHIIIISHNYNNYYEVINWIQKQEYYKLISLYALSISYEIIREHINTIKIIWFEHDNMGD
jgi:hypothetical protein